MKKKQDDVFGAFVALVLWFSCICITLMVSIILLPLVLLRLGKILHWSVRTWAKLLSNILGLKFEIENKKNLSKDKAFILLVNHQSYIDILALYWALDAPIVWMAKASLFKIPFFGWAMSAIGCIPVKRGKVREARDSLYKAAMLVREGRSLVIFPEGTRGKPNGGLISFKKGAFVLAKKAKVPVQAVTIYGPNMILPIHRKTWIPRFYVNNIIRVVIHKPIQSIEYDAMDPIELQNKIYKIIDRPIDRLRAFNQVLD